MKNNILINHNLKTPKIAKILTLIAFLSTVFLFIIAILGVAKVIPFFQVERTITFKIGYLIVTLIFYAFLAFILVCDLLTNIGLAHVKEKEDLVSISTSLKKAKNNMLFITILLSFIIIFETVVDWKLLSAGNIWMILYLVASGLLLASYITNQFVANNNIKKIAHYLEQVSIIDAGGSSNI